MLFRDARDYQILFLLVFLVLGIGTRDWTLRPDLMLVVTASCLVTQILASFWFDWDKKSLHIPPQYQRYKRLYGFFEFLSRTSLKSALITSLGLCLLLRSNNYQTMALAGSLAILSKFIFTNGKKHFFNPANFGIIAALMLTEDAWVSPGQWGDDRWYLMLFIFTGGLVLKQVGRWDTSIAFLGFYGGLEAMRNIYLGWSWDVWQHHFFSGSLLLFSFFMITDPRSIPNARWGRIIWAAIIALGTFILRDYYYLSTAALWVLFCAAPLTLLLDRLSLAEPFSWKRQIESVSAQSKKMQKVFLKG
jgi:Na+-transporting NADH:ubiquinone oxidoreductase subunit NqrB